MFYGQNLGTTTLEGHREFLLRNPFDTGRDLATIQIRPHKDDSGMGGSRHKSKRHKTA